MTRAPKVSPAPSPPHTSFKAFKLALGFLQANGVPAKIDRSVWRKGFGPAAAVQLSGVFTFLALTEKDGGVTPALQPLLDAYQGEGWAGDLEKVLRQAYAPIFELALEGATKAQLEERFQECYRVEGVRRRKCIEFFLSAVRETDLMLSPYLVSRHYSASPALTAPGADQHLTDKLVDKFPAYDPDWPDSIKERWFAGFLELMQRAKGRP